MMETPTLGRPVRQVLVSHPGARPEGDWIAGLTRYLEEHEVAVQRAYTGRQAVELVDGGRVDAVVLSGDRPPMEGLSVLRIIRTIRADLPCVMVLTEVSTRSLQQALELGAYSVVRQPVDVLRLQRVMVRLFRRRFDWNLE